MFLLLHLTVFTFHKLSILLGPVPLLKMLIFVIERLQKKILNRVTDLINFGKHSRDSTIEIFLLLDFYHMSLVRLAVTVRVRVKIRFEGASRMYFI